MTIASPMPLTFIQGHKCISVKLSYFLTCNLRYLSYYIQTWHHGRLMDALYAHFDDLDIDARSQWVSKGNNKKSALHALGN